jgi:CRISPR-associated protein (TIGR02710 family)
MLKALIMSVGAGIGINEKIATESLANALVFSIKQQNPDEIFFVASLKSRRTVLPKILQQTKIKNHIIKIENPDDINYIYGVLLPKFKKIRRQYDNVAVDCTSGTKTMTSAMAILGTICDVNSLSYISGERSGGLVQAGTEKLITVQPRFMVAEQKMKTAIEFFNHNQFEVAIAILEEIKESIRSQDLTKRVDPLLLLAKAYSLWNKFEHDKAFQIIRGMKMEQLADNKSFLGHLLEAKKEANEESSPKKGVVRPPKLKRPEPYYIADMINNAERTGDEKKYDDAVARLYRTIELIAQYTLKKEYNIQTSNVKVDQVPEELLKKWPRPTTGTLKLPLEKDYELLETKKHPLGEKYLRDKKLKDLLSKRNASILAHGLNPVDQNTFITLQKKTKEYAKIVIENLSELLKAAKFIKWPEVNQTKPDYIMKNPASEA